MDCAGAILSPLEVTRRWRSHLSVRAVCWCCDSKCELTAKECPLTIWLWFSPEESLRWLLQRCLPRRRSPSSWLQGTLHWWRALLGNSRWKSLLAAMAVSRPYCCDVFRNVRLSSHGWNETATKGHHCKWQLEPCQHLSGPYVAMVSTMITKAMCQERTCHTLTASRPWHLHPSCPVPLHCCKVRRGQVGSKFRKTHPHLERSRSVLPATQPSTLVAARDTLAAEHLSAVRILHLPSGPSRRRRKSHQIRIIWLQRRLIACLNHLPKATVFRRQRILR